MLPLERHTDVAILPDTVNDHESFSFSTLPALLSIIRNCRLPRHFYTIPIACGCVLFIARLSDVPLEPFVPILRHAHGTFDKLLNDSRIAVSDIQPPGSGGQFTGN